MEAEFTDKERKKIFRGIKKKYSKVAKKPEGLFKYPTGRAGLEGLGYNDSLLQSLPEKAVSSFCGVGNPFTLGPINKGESVLDIGCGGGVDTMVAATMVGPEGKVVGIEMIPMMLKRARKNLEETSIKNITLEEASAEDLPLPGSSNEISSEITCYHIYLIFGIPLAKYIHPVQVASGTYFLFRYPSEPCSNLKFPKTFMFCKVTF